MVPLESGGGSLRRGVAAGIGTGTDAAGGEALRCRLRCPGPRAAAGGGGRGGGGPGGGRAAGVSGRCPLHAFRQTAVPAPRRRVQLLICAHSLSSRLTLTGWGVRSSC